MGVNMVVHDKLSIYSALDLLSEDQLKALAALLNSFVVKTAPDDWNDMSDEEYSECLQNLAEMSRGERVSLSFLDD
jgi:hypothetical protein